LKTLAKLPIHPIFLAIYPVSWLYAHNIAEASAMDFLRLALYSLLGGVLLFGLCRLILRNWEKAALAASLALVFFFSYGHLYNALEGFDLMGMVIGRHRILAPLWGGLFLLLYWRLLRPPTVQANWTATLNLSAALLLAFPLAQITASALKDSAPHRTAQDADESHALQIPAGQPAPDIYYIILDGYARDDVLRKNYQLDNSAFLDQLRQMGFFVAECSQSNYAQTQLSLASSLNFDYLEALNSQYTAGYTSRSGLSELIQHSAARRLLQGLGYQFLAFDSGYDPTRIRDADRYFSASADRGLSDFDNLFLRTTAARLISEGVTLLNIPPDWEARDQAHRQRILYTLETLKSLPAELGPKFVFAHLIIPHWPHVFGADGQPVHTHPDSVSGYRDQVIFINKQILPILAQILAESSTAPIIILQGDHGSVIESPQRRMSILNAYYLPGVASEALYSSISPVNTFRVIFNQFFGGDFALLPDLGYYSVYERPYDYTLIPNDRPGCNGE